MKRLFSWKGCLIGCGSLILLTIIFGAITIHWLTKKEEFAVAPTILTPQTELYARIFMQAEDEILVRFFTENLNALNENSPGMQAMPDFFKQWQRGSTKRDVLKMMPFEIEIAGMASQNQFTGSVGFSVYNNLVGVGFWFFKRSAKKQGNLREIQGRQYVVLSEGREEEFYLALNKNIFYLSNDAPAMEQMLLAGEVAESTHQTESRLRGVDLTAPVYGFVDSDDIDWALLLEDGPEILDENEDLRPVRVEDLPFLRTTTRIAFDMRVESKDSLIGQLFVDTEQTPENRAALERALPMFITEEQLELTTEIRETDSGYAVNYRIAGFEELSKSFNQTIRYRR